MTTNRCSMSRLGHREAFLLMHVDGVTTLLAIAKMVALPLDEVMECFEELEASGFIEFVAPGESTSVGRSGVFLKLSCLPSDIHLDELDEDPLGFDDEDAFVGR